MFRYRARGTGWPEECPDYASVLMVNLCVPYRVEIARVAVIVTWKSFGLLTNMPLPVPQMAPISHNFDTHSRLHCPP